MERKLPEIVNCSNCQRLLVVELNIAFPDYDTDRENVTYIIEPRYLYFSVQCRSCGHYSVFTPYDN